MFLLGKKKFSLFLPVHLIVEVSIIMNVIYHLRVHVIFQVNCLFFVGFLGIIQNANKFRLYLK